MTDSSQFIKERKRGWKNRFKKQQTVLSKQGVQLITLDQQTSPISEMYRAIRTNIQAASLYLPPIQTIVVTSSGPGEGKSTISANLAIVFAQSGHRVLLVDADLRKPTVHRTFHLENNQGLSLILSQKHLLETEIQETDVDNLTILTSGPIPANPSELLSSSAMTELVDTVRRSFDVVLFDMPPLVLVADSQIMAGKVDGTLLIVREQVSKKEELIRAKELLEMVHARVLGVVYNGSQETPDMAYNYFFDS